jgi:diguanylate cyclase (GGDEF)-like protein
VLVSGTPLTKDERYAGTLGTITDITDRKRGEAELQKANEELTSWLNEAKQQTRDISLLNELGELLHTTQTTAEAYGLIPQLLPSLFPRAAGLLFVVQEAHSLIEAMAQWGPVAGEPEPFDINDCWALRRGHIHVVQCVNPDLEAGQLPAIICNHVREPRPPAYFCVPMVAQNESLGVLHLQRPAIAAGAEAQPAWSEAQMRLARMVADTLAMALVSLRLRETLRHQSIRDPLTGLFNRRYLEETLEREIHRARREQLPLGVMMLDLDRFKQLNDSSGHEAGDQLLRAVSSVLKANARAEDIACRYGGEEFLLILPGASLELTLARAEKICEAVRAIGADFRRDGHDAMTISIGVAAFPEHGDKGADVVRVADATLYQAKRAGRDQVMAAG